MRVILAGAVALCAMLPTLAWSVEAQDEESITMNDVPVQVKASAQAAANGTKLDKVGLDLDDGTATYEFSGKNAEGKTVEIDVSHEGRIEEFEQEISMDSVPEAVKKMLTKHLPKFKAETAEKSTRENFEVYYEFDGQGDDGQELDVEIRSDGKRIIIQDDAAA
jgi:uncharacterized membrane protein YkoI